jgi:hypothetical protein
MVKDLPRAALGTYKRVWLESKSAYFPSISSTRKALGPWRQLHISNNRIVARIRAVTQTSVTGVLEKLKEFSAITEIQGKPKVSSALISNTGFIHVFIMLNKSWAGARGKLFLAFASTVILDSESGGIHGHIILSHTTEPVCWSLIPIKSRDCVFLYLFICYSFPQRLHLFRSN